MSLPFKEWQERVRLPEPPLNMSDAAEIARRAYPEIVRQLVREAIIRRLREAQYGAPPSGTQSPR